MISSISMASRELSWESIPCLMSGEIPAWITAGKGKGSSCCSKSCVSESGSHQKLRAPSSSFTLSSWCFGLFYQQHGKKLMLIKSADDPKIEGAEISRKAGP